ncbi:ATP-binding protein [Actinophytocola sp.]|uniref:ATP-binding protein n=1 Tax=Actinophytocola sp. TaxID=1872138 RepID=UPI002D6844B2|nr:ATP-binding protein [Actinophytocola sp.]HYQ65299.1 ATP-binding protein [Actinophytocola sp.]
MIRPLIQQAESTAEEQGPGTPSPRAVVEITDAGHVCGWNPAAVVLYGYEAEEIVGLPMDVLCSPESLAGEQAVLRQISAGGVVERYEAIRVRKDGTTIRVSVTAEPVIGPEGGVVGVTTVSWEAEGQQGDADTPEETTGADRRERRDGVERSEVSADAERRVDRDGVERSEVSADAERREGRGTLERSEVTAGAERRERRDGVERSEVIADAERREDRDGVERSEVTADAERREARDTLERTEVTADAERREARDTLERSEVTADAERRDYRDTLERKERSQAQAQRLESLGQLAGGVAHDFNNLLAVILNYVSFVAEEVAAASGPDPASHLETASADLEQIKKAAERAARLTHQLLVFARRDVIRPQVLDLDKVITTVEEMLRRTIGEHVELVTSLAGDLWPVLADPGQLEQVLVNLAVNARDAMPSGGTLTIDTGNLTVDASALAGGSKARLGRNVRLRVSDNGTGMPAKVVQHVFEPFFTTKSDSGGTGLGLATIYGILTQADGSIGIYSEPGAGTTFTITLPATVEAATPVVESVPYQRVPKGETVLVVEDEEALREVTRRIFTRNGYHVITAASGPEALDIAANHQGEIHLLITDVVMPRMLGKEVAEKMRVIKPEIEVIFMSGYARPVLASQGRLEPGVALVEKPFSEAHLLATVGQVLNGHFQGFSNIGGNAP